ncbi:MAG: hypothetical protein ACXADH_03415 [Candidatus Kariarchaeaceae archaeon]|jgi:hypothetical protein
MGFDLYGITPHNEQGKFLSINIWGWRPLWHIVCNYTPALSQHDREKGHVNEGYVISGEKHAAIIETLTKLVREKPRRIEYEAQTNDFGVLFGGVPIQQLDPGGFGSYGFSWDIAESLLRFCEGNDGFKIK